MVHFKSVLYIQGSHFINILPAVHCSWPFKHI